MDAHVHAHAMSCRKNRKASCPPWGISDYLVAIHVFMFMYRQNQTDRQTHRHCDPRQSHLGPRLSVAQHGIARTGTVLVHLQTRTLHAPSRSPSGNSSRANTPFGVFDLSASLDSMQMNAAESQTLCISGFHAAYGPHDLSAAEAQRTI